MADSMTHSDMVAELKRNEVHLTDEYRNSNYYAEYLKIMANDMVNNLKIENRL